MNLRPYQRQAIDSVHNYWADGGENPLDSNQIVISRYEKTSRIRVWSGPSIAAEVGDRSARRRLAIFLRRRQEVSKWTYFSEVRIKRKLLLVFEAEFRQKIRSRVRWCFLKGFSQSNQALCIRQRRKYLCSGCAVQKRPPSAMGVVYELRGVRQREPSSSTTTDESGENSQIVRAQRRGSRSTVSYARSRMLYMRRCVRNQTRNARRSLSCIGSSERSFVLSLQSSDWTATRIEGDHVAGCGVCR